MDRNYNTISPSARSLLLMKGMTPIPYAREAAELMSYPEQYTPDYSNKEVSFWARLAHFENRYASIDQLLEDIPAKNILELSSGFSFRGLNAVKQRDVHYIDTDLPDLITTKINFVTTLQQGDFETKGTLETIPLNALDEEQFTNIINRFPPGEIVIVNEGLLMYLGEEEKEKLLGIIHKVLEERGGYWITADIYLKGKMRLRLDDKLQQFFDQHRIEDNKFESFEAAEALFNKAGFVVDKEAKIDYTKTSALEYLLKNTTEEQLAEGRKVGRINTTWRLKVN
jgi:O-methyltransferase involved in polyketide biosynthesis